jgi:hypothetical protein
MDDPGGHCLLGGGGGRGGKYGWQAERRRWMQRRVGAVMVRHGADAAIGVVLLVVMVVETGQQHGKEQHNGQQKRGGAFLRESNADMSG